MDSLDSRIVNQEVVAMAVGWVPNRPKADPNGSGVNRLDTDDILAPHSRWEYFGPLWVPESE